VIPDANPSMDYQLRVDVAANQTLAPTDAPIAFSEPDPPGDVVVDLVGLNKTTNAMVWDGEDNFLGQTPIDGPTRLNLTEGESGPYVVLVPGEDGVIRLAPFNATQSQARLEPFGFQLQQGEPKQVPDGGNVIWEFTPRSVPVQAGSYMTASNPNYQQASRAR